MMNSTRQTSKYIVMDLLTAASAWTILFIYRKTIIESENYGYSIEVNFDRNYFMGFALIPLFWVILYWSSGHYSTISRRHRIKEIGQLLMTSIIGVIVIFFVLLLDDQLGQSNPDIGQGLGRVQRGLPFDQRRISPVIGQDPIGGHGHFPPIVAPRQ